MSRIRRFIPAVIIASIATLLGLAGCQNISRGFADPVASPTKADHTLYFFQHPDFHKQLSGDHDFDLDLGQTFDATKLKVMSVAVDTVDLVYVPNTHSPRDKPDDLELVDVERWQVQPEDGRPHVTVARFCTEPPPAGQDPETCCDESRTWSTTTHAQYLSKAQAAFATGHLKIRVHPSQGNDYQVVRIVVDFHVEP